MSIKLSAIWIITLNASVCGLQSLCFKYSRYLVACLLTFLLFTFTSFMLFHMANCFEKVTFLTPLNSFRLVVASVTAQRSLYLTVVHSIDFIFNTGRNGAQHTQKEMWENNNTNLTNIIKAVCGNLTIRFRIEFELIRIYIASAFLLLALFLLSNARWQRQWEHWNSYTEQIECTTSLASSEFHGKYNTFSIESIHNMGQGI